jgi:hypothetical protein
VDERIWEWAPLLEPRQTALSVVDVQQRFTQMTGRPLYPPVADVLRRMRRVVDGARSVLVSRPAVAGGRRCL